MLPVTYGGIGDIELGKKNGEKYFLKYFTHS